MCMCIHIHINSGFNEEKNLKARYTDATGSLNVIAQDVVHRYKLTEFLSCCHRMRMIDDV